MSGKKPSPVANLILLVLVLALVAGVGGGAFWAYNKWVKGSNEEIVDIVPAPDDGSDSGENPVSPGIAIGIPLDPTPTPESSDEITNDGTVSSGAPVATEEVATQEGTTAVAVAEATAENPVVADPVVADPVVADPVPVNEGDTETESTENPQDLPERTEEPELVAYSKDSPEGQALLADALRRVDESPSTTAQKKARAKKGLREAKHLGKIATVYFATSGAKLTNVESSRLEAAIEQVSIKAMTENAKAICFVLGFADKTGPADYNKRLSMSRAQSVISKLEKAGLKLSTMPVAIGPSELVDKENQGKNRAAEVWIVVP